MNQKEFDACWATIRTVLRNGPGTHEQGSAIAALQKLEIECRADRSLLEVRTVIDHHVAEEKQTAHFEYAARRLRGWLAHKQMLQSHGREFMSDDAAWLAAEIKRTNGVVTPLPVPMQRGRRTPRTIHEAIPVGTSKTTTSWRAEYQQTPILTECICPVGEISRQCPIHSPPCVCPADGVDLDCPRHGLAREGGVLRAPRGVDR